MDYEKIYSAIKLITAIVGGSDFALVVYDGANWIYH